MGLACTKKSWRTRFWAGYFWVQIYCTIFNILRFLPKVSSLPRVKPWTRCGRRPNGCKESVCIRKGECRAPHERGTWSPFNYQLICVAVSVNGHNWCTECVYVAAWNSFLSCRCHRLFSRSRHLTTTTRIHFSLLSYLNLSIPLIRF